MEELAPVDDVLGGVQGQVTALLLVHLVHHGLDGGGVVDVLHVLAGDVGAAQEVDELLGQLLLLAVGRNAHGVHPHVAALFGHHVGQLLRLHHGVQGVAGPHQRHGRFAGDHLILGLVHQIALDDAVLALLDQQLLSFLQLGLVPGVHGITQGLEGHAQGISDGVQHEHALGARSLHVEDVLPAGDLVVHQFGVVQDAHGAPHVGHGVFTGGVVIRLFQPLLQVGHVGHVVQVQLGQAVFLNHALDDIIGRENYVVLSRPCGQLGVHLLVGGEVGVFDLDTRLVLELVDHVFVDVVVPVEHGDVLGQRGGGNQAKQQYQDQGNLFHVLHTSTCV